jgi:murein tripeptide amidase MpaA
MNVDVIASPQALPSLLKAIPSLNYSVMIDNVQSLIDDETDHSLKHSELQSANFAAGKPLSAASIFSDYQDAAIYVEYLASLPGTEKISIGKSYLGSEIYGVKFGTGSKHIVAHGGIHAREWISPATTTYVANELLGDSADAVHLRSTFTFTIIPVLNVDV